MFEVTKRGFFKRSKYGNHRVYCLSKHLHDSKLEANYCNRLLAMQQAREISHYETQVSFDLNVEGKLICKHIVDFCIWKNDPHPCEVHDTKGMKTDVWRLKHKLFEALYPYITYVVVTKDEDQMKKTLIGA